MQTSLLDTVVSLPTLGITLLSRVSGDGEFVPTEQNEASAGSFENTLAICNFLIW